jgi:NitT/TauT family transport system permease protein
MKTECWAPILFGVFGLLIWQGAVIALHVPVYVLPGPIAIIQAFFADWQSLLISLVATLAIAAASLLAAAMLGMMLALAMAASRWARAAIQPWAVVLQVTPVVALAPLIIIWVHQQFLALVVCATIVGFFPVLSNTAAGLAATPPALLDLFRLNGASRWQIVFLLRLPSALPFFLAGLRIAGTLALVGAVVAEFVASSGGFASGLAGRILEAGYRLEIPRMFAALTLLALAGIAIYAALGAFERGILKRVGAVSSQDHAP